MSSTSATIDVKKLYQETVIGLMVVNPFFYHWLQQLRFTHNPRVKTAAVAYDKIGECGRIFINAPFFHRLTLRQRLFVLMHELMHWVYQHPLMPEGNRRFFNIAADVYINTQLMKNKQADMPEGFDEGITWDNLGQMAPSLDMSTRPENDVGTLAILEWLEESIRRQPVTPIDLSELAELLDQLSEDPDNDGMSGFPGGEVTIGLDQDDQQESDDAEPEDAGDPNRPQDLDPGRHLGDPEEQLRGGQGLDEPRLPTDAGDTGAPGPGQSGPSPADAAKEEAEKQLSELADDLADDHELWHDYGDPQKAEGAMHRLAQDLQEARERTDPEDFEKGCGMFAGAIHSIIEAAKEPKVNWKQQMRSFVGYCGAVILRGTYGQFNKYRQMPKIKLLPGTKLAILFDTSGSVSKSEAAAFLAEMEALDRDGIELLWVEFDAQVQHVAKFRKNKEYQTHGGGGTSFQAAFEWVKDNWKKENLTGVIVCTDGECAWPTADTIPDPKRVLWVITNKRYIAPPTRGRTTHIKVGRTA